MSDTAILSSFDQYTTFSFKGVTLTFRTCNHLERYISVLCWADGYLEVMAKYAHISEPIEEYIDLRPVIDDLYMSRAEYLDPIRNVIIQYD